MRLSDDLNATRWIYAKGILFVLLTMMASSLLFAQMPSWENAALLAVAIWAACRADYGVFHVIEHYVDSEFCHSGLVDFAPYVVRRRSQDGASERELKKVLHPN